MDFWLTSGVPLWLISTRGEGEKPGDDGRGRWVWAVFYMWVGE